MNQTKTGQCIESPLRTIIVGAGGIAGKHADALLRIPGVKVTAVLDPREANAKSLAEKCGAPVISRLEEALEEAEMIHLLTPPSKRLNYARAAMTAGKHIFCEKPVAVDPAEAGEMARLSRETGVFFMTAFNMRFRPGYRMLQEDVLSGKLGDIISLWIHRIGPGSGFNGPLGDSWRTDPNLVCGMTIESLSHDIDMIRGFGLEIEKAAAWVYGGRVDLPAFDNHAQILLGLSGGRSGVINASWASFLPMSSRGVVGVRGTAALCGGGFFDFMDYRLKTDAMAYEQISRVNDPFDGESYYAENKHFIECIRNARKPLTTAENGLEALKVSLAILESSKTGKAVCPGGIR
jgi:myo-inositol 2-dehydrogenase/D-chiro-inositol 1-dehydrogenase